MLNSNFIKLVFVSVSVISILFLVPMMAAEKPQSIKKQTKSGKYLSAIEAYNLKQTKGQDLLFVDIRTPSELVFVGTPENFDINIPFLTLDYKQWDEKKSSFKKIPNKQFLSGFSAVIQSKSLSKDTSVILLCRSGKRSAKAANLLTTMGYSNVYTVVDGFEGDKEKAGNSKGKRGINGWKNAGLPWTYKLDRDSFQLDK
ncbi:MAG: rhodanese-like domain-containing protein [Cocleimonas sp.]